MTSDCLAQIAKYEGLMALWGGLASSLVLVTNPAINYMVYEALKRNVFYVFELWVGIFVPFLLLLLLFSFD